MVYAGGPALPDTCTRNWSYNCYVVCLGPYKHWFKYCFQCRNLNYGDRAVFVLRPTNCIDGYAEIQQEAYSFWALDLGPTWASDQLFLACLLFICHHIHGLPTVSTCQRGKYELRKRCLWSGHDNRCCLLADYRKTRIQGPDQRSSRQ